MTQTVVVHVKDGCDIYIGRAVGPYPASVWGNPYKVADYGRGEALRKYREMFPDELLGRVGELQGKRLGCWCAPRGKVLTADDPHVCHGQFLAELADGGPTQPSLFNS